MTDWVYHDSLFANCRNDLSFAHTLFLSKSINFENSNGTLSINDGMGFKFAEIWLTQQSYRDTKTFKFNRCMACSDKAEI